MNPIVNPLWFYVINVLSTLNEVSHVLAFLSTASSLLFVGLYIAESHEDEENQINFKIYVKYSLICLVVSSILMILIPTKSVLYQMLVASYVTPDNIQIVQNNTVQFIQQVVDALKEVK